MGDLDIASIFKAVKTLEQYPNEVYKTPLIQHVEKRLVNIGCPPVSNLMLKLENMQFTGSFKVRGVINQFHNLTEQDRVNRRPLVTMSAGNYGKAFSYVAQINNMPATVFMSESAPEERKQVMENYGANVVRGEKLLQLVHSHQIETGSLFLHPFDDPVLMLGHATAGYELYDEVKHVDIVLVCSGGGGYLAGVAAALRTFGMTKTRIYGIEPEHSPTMYNAFKKTNIELKPTIASGLAPPFCGKFCLEVCKKHVDDILLVSESDLVHAVSTLYKIGLVVEPSGAAAMAVLLSSKVPDVEGKSVAVFITGGNVSPTELTKYVS